MPLTQKITIDEIMSNFEFLDEWDDKYLYLIELGKSLMPLKEDEMNEKTKVRGCVSQVWVVCQKDGEAFEFRGASDAHIVRGLVAIVLVLFSGKTADEIKNIDETQTFEAIGLEEHLTPQRSNGLRAMVKRLREMTAD